jgi:hypothetical protein
MHSLFFRIFMLFWLAMALIVIGSVAVTYGVAAREYESQEWQRRPSVAISASEAFASGGMVSLRRWLSENENAVPDRDLFIVAPDGRDILGRRLSESAQRRLEFITHEAQAAVDTRGPPEERNFEAPRPFGEHPPDHPPQNFRPSRQAPQIVAPDGTVYTILVVPRRPSIFGALALPGIPLAVLAIALIVSALASWSLAQHLSAPIRRIQEVRARSRPNNWMCASAQVSTAARTSSPCSRATSMRWPINSRQRAARAPNCCATSRMNCGRRSRACASPWGWRASRTPSRRCNSIGWTAKSNAWIP